MSDKEKPKDLSCPLCPEDGTTKEDIDALLKEYSNQIFGKEIFSENAAVSSTEIEVSFDEINKRVCELLKKDLVQLVKAMKERLGKLRPQMGGEYNLEIEGRRKELKLNIDELEKLI